MACESGLACVGADGCVEPFANGTVGEILQIGVGGVPDWVPVTLHDPVTLGAGSSPALTLSGQELTLALTATNTFYAGGPAGTPLASISTVEAALDAIAPCMICSVDASNTCADGGIGANNMVRFAAVAGDGRLVINSAPEHTTNEVRAFSAASVHFQPIPTTITQGINPVIATIVNPSACRQMLVEIHITSYSTNFFLAPDAVNVFYTVDSNINIGGAAAADYVAGNSDIQILLPPSAGSYIFNYHLAPFHTTRIIPPAGSLQVYMDASIKPQIVNPATSPNSFVDIEGGAILLVGHTI
jgi:hypothetical protein